MLRRKIQRASFITNLLGYVVLLSVVIAHVVHRYSAANVSGGDDGDVTFWFEGSQEGDDQPHHHRPFSLFNCRVLLGVGGTFLISGLCDAGGIAGAGLFVPLFCLVVGFGLKAATGLAQAAISGVSLASLLFSSLFRSHPWDSSKTLVDFDLALLLLPSLLLGVTVGVMLNDLLPNWFINALLVALLLYVCHRKLIGGLTAWDEEAQHEMNLLAAAAISSRPMPQLRPICIHISRGASSSSSSAATTPQRKQQQQQQQQQQQKDVAAAEDCGSSSSSGGAERLAKQEAEVITSDPSTPPTPYVGGGRDNSRTGSSIFGPAPAVWQQQLQQEQQQQRAWSISSGGDFGDTVPSPQQQQQPVSIVDQQQEQQQWQQQQQQSEALDSSSSTSSGLRAPLLSPAAHWQSHTTLISSSAFDYPAAAAAAAAFAPRLLPPLPENQPAAAAAAAVAQRHVLSPSHSVVSYFRPAQFDFIGMSSFPWIKFGSVCTLWLGFLGLSALNSLIPLCSWYYINYMLSFLTLTVLVTVLFTKLTQLDPCSWNRRSPADECIEEGRASGDVAAAAAAAAGSGSGGWLAAIRAAAASCRRWSIIWINVLSGATLKVPDGTAAAVAGGGGGSGEGSPPRLSLFKQALLQQQQEVLAEAAAAAEEPFPCIGSAAGPAKVHYATLAAAAAAAVAGAAGIASGVCGVAGGALLTPVLLDFRIHPQVAAATSVLLVFMSSSGAVLSFIMQGRLVGSYAVLFWSVSVLGACVGVGLVGALVRKMRCRASVVILLLSGLVGVACVSSTVYGVREFVRDYQSDQGVGFRALCSYT